MATLYTSPSATIIASLEQLSINERGFKERCVICLEDDDTPWVKLPCRHRYHHTCVERNLVRNGSCPLCRQTLPPGVDGKDAEHTAHRYLARVCLERSLFNLALEIAIAARSQFSTTSRIASEVEALNHGLVNILISDCYLHLDRFRAAIRVINVTLASNLPFSCCQRADALRLKANALYGRDGEERAKGPANELLEEAAVLDPKAKLYVAKIGGDGNWIAFAPSLMAEEIDEQYKDHGSIIHNVVRDDLVRLHCS